MRAGRGPAGPAGRAGAARNVRLDHDALPGAAALDPGSGRGDLAERLVPDHPRERRRLPPPRVQRQVGPADADAADPDEHLAGPGLRLRPVADHPERPGLGVQHDRAHQPATASSACRARRANSAGDRSRRAASDGASTATGRPSGSTPSTLAQRKLALAGQQPHRPRLGHRVLVRRPGGSVAQLQVAEQRRIDGRDFLRGGPAALDVQRVEEQPGPARTRCDRHRAGQRAERPPGHELDDRADPVGPGHLDEFGQPVGEPSGVGVRADDVQVPGPEHGRRLQHGFAPGRARTGLQPDRLHVQDDQAGVAAAAHGLGQHGRARPGRPGLLAPAHRRDPQPHRVEPRPGRHRDELGRRQIEHGLVIQPANPRHPTSAPFQPCAVTWPPHVLIVNELTC